MRNPKKPRISSRQKTPTAKTKPDQLGLLETYKLRRLGQQDGHRRLPKQDENGLWTSPLIRKECGTYDEFSIFTWKELQATHENHYKEIAELCQNIPILENQLAVHQNNAPPPADLTERIQGEEKLPEQIIRSRRRRDYEKHHSGYFSKLRNLESKLDEGYRRLAEMQSIIQAAEKTARMLCEQFAGKAEQRIITYWNGALKTHPKFKEIPPSPEIILESEAESDYLIQNNPIKDETNRILEHRKHGGTVANTGRTEEYDVSK